MKQCTKCGEVKELTAFSKRAAMKDGLRSQCKTCDQEFHKLYYSRTAEKARDVARKYYWEHREESLEKSKKYQRENRGLVNKTARKRYAKDPLKKKLSIRKRRAVHKKATPVWYNEEEVAKIYTIAKERNLVVDHIVPLNSHLVCGLNVQDNLRCISSKLNSLKSNRYWPDSPEQVQQKAQQLLQNTNQ